MAKRDSDSQCFIWQLTVMLWAASSKTMPLSMRKTCGFRSSCVCTNYQSGICLRETFCSKHWFCLRTIKVLIRLRRCTSWSRSSLSTYASRTVSHDATLLLQRKWNLTQNSRPVAFAIVRNIQKNRHLFTDRKYNMTSQTIEKLIWAAKSEKGSFEYLRGLIGIFTEGG